MPSIIEGYTYDIFISYRQNDNKYDGWVTEFVDNLNKELEANIKDKISVYFDINPRDGLLETDSVDKSLEGKLKCLIFIPIISRTYCDPKSFAWQHEFSAYNKLAKEDKFGRDIRLSSGNVASRILPIKIHDLDPEDKTLLENELGGILRCVEFIYKSAGVNRPLRASEDHPQDNLNKTYYRDQINKVANAIKEIITALKKQSQHLEEVTKQDFEVKPASQKNLRTRIIAGSLILLALIIVGLFIVPKLFKPSETLEKSVAVLPFVNLSNDLEQEYFSDGVVEAILNHLFKVGDLKVISSTSTKRYKNTKLPMKEIARELGVSSILEGSVQKIGNNVRITAQLIDARTDVHLWSEIYDKDISDIFAIQSEVAQNVAKELKATLTQQETDLIQKTPSTTSQLAYEFYLKGNDYWSKFNTFLALDMYSKAIQVDSLYADAYAQRAKMHAYIYWSRVRNSQGHDLLAMEDVKKGLQLNPESTEVKFVESVMDYWLYRNYDKSLIILKELKKEAPNMADLYAFTSYILRRQGKMEESIIEAKQSILLDPFNANYINNLLQTYDILHQQDNRIEYARQGLSLIPDYRSFNKHIYDSYLKKTGDLKTALIESGLKEQEVQYDVYYYTRQYNKLIEFLTEAKPIITDDQYEYYPKTYLLALIHNLSGNTSVSKIYADSAIIHLKEQLKELPDDDRFYSTLGKCYALISNYKEAIAFGEKGVDIKPIKLDAYQGVYREQDLMQIYVLTGNYDKALDKIEFLLSIPSLAAIGDLLIDPIYDNMRSLPRFQKIIENAHK